MSTAKPLSEQSKQLHYYKDQEFRTLADNSPDVIVRYDAQLNRIYTNPAWDRISAISSVGLLTESSIDKTPRPSHMATRYETNLKKVLENRESGDVELTLLDENNQSLFFTQRLVPEYDSEGNVIGVLTIARDITPYKKLQDSLLVREREFRSLAENQPDNIARWDTTGHYLYINPTHEKTLGLSVAEVIGTRLPNEHTAVKEAIAQVATTGQKVIVHQRVPGKNGEMEIHDVTLAPEFDSTGRLVSILGIGRDMTEHYKQEKLLRQSEARFRHFFERQLVGMAITSPTKGWLQSNEKLQHMLGYTHEELTQLTWSEITHPDDVPQDMEYFERLLSGEINDYLLEKRFIRKNGTVIYTKLAISCIRRKDQRIDYVLALIEDITKRKNAESALLENQIHLQTIIENEPECIKIIDGEGRLVYMNPAGLDMIEATLEQVQGKEVLGVIVEKHRDPFVQMHRRVIAGEKVHLIFETVGLKGKHCWLETTSVPMQMGGKTVLLGVTRDITDKKEQEAQLHRTKAKLAAVINTIPDLVWVKDAEGVYMMCNPSFENFFGASCGEIIGKTDYNFLSKEQADFFRQKDTEALAAGEICINEEEIVFALGGQRAILETRKIPVYNGKEFMGVLGIGRDITERKQLEEEILLNQSRLNEAQKIAQVGSWELEFPGLLLTWSDEIYRIFEIDPYLYEPSYDHFLNAIHPDDRELVDRVYAKSLTDKASYEITHRLLMEDGRIKYVNERGETLYDAHGNPTRSIGTVQDVTNQKSVEKKIKHMAHHDALTGLPNRLLAKELAEQIMASAKRTGSKAAFLFIDLDGFKTINDSLGHAAGDTILKTIATRLKKCVRESDTISRQGGDEFLVILSNIKEANDSASTTQKILKALEQSFELATHTLSISGSIGIALYPDHGKSFETLLQCADTAMYKAKESGKNGYCFYTQQMNHDILGQFKIQNDLKNALLHSEFILHYQPQIDLATNTITGVEALIRWNHSQLGMIPPMSFIPIAEESGLIVLIGQWVIEEACSQAARWHKMGIEITVAINISAVQFKRGNLEDVVKNALIASKIDPKYLELELTESVMMHNVETTLKTVQTLKALGVQLSIDDFGTGYSSLAYLKRFSVDKLKIDQSFVRNILSDQEDAVIVQTIIQMAKNLNLKSIAEGVETQEIVELIESYGCDEVQGYHYAKPLEASDFENFYAAFGSETVS